MLIDNFRPGTLARLGFPDDTIRELNSGIIYATASGFGYSGPDQEKPAYDSIIQALSGIISITGTESGETVRVGTSISDIITGSFTAIGIISALLRKERQGMGARLDVAMLDCAVSVLENAIARYQVSGENPTPLGSRHPSITPFETFSAKDGQIMIAAGNDKLFAGLCRVLGDESIAADSRFLDNAGRTENFQALRDILNERLARAPIADWLAQLNAANIPCAKINKVSDLFASEQLNTRNMLLPVDSGDDFKIAGNPIKFTDVEEADNAGKPPVIGEHSEEILTDVLGYSADRIQQLCRSKALSGTKA